MKEALGAKSDTELSRALGISKATVSSWRVRNHLPFDVCAKVAADCRVSLDYLIFGKDAAEGLLTFPLIDPLRVADRAPADAETKGARGPHRSADSEAYHDQLAKADRVLFPGYLVPERLRDTANEYLLVVVRGDAMEPTLRDGDLLLVSGFAEVAQEGIHVIMVDGRLVPRRLGGGQIICDNAAYPAIKPKPGGHTVAGRVIWIGRQL